MPITSVQVSEIDISMINEIPPLSNTVTFKSMICLNYINFFGGSYPYRNIDKSAILTLCFISCSLLPAMPTVVINLLTGMPFEISLLPTWIMTSSNFWSSLLIVCLCLDISSSLLIPPIPFPAIGHLRTLPSLRRRM